MWVQIPLPQSFSKDIKSMLEVGLEAAIAFATPDKSGVFKEWSRHPDAQNATMWR